MRRWLACWQATLPDVPRGKPDAECFRLDREVNGRRKGDRLSVDPGRDGSAGLDAQRLRAPRSARRVRGTRWRVDHDDSQLPAVECGACPASRRALEGVGVVGDQHHRGTAVRASAVVDEAQVGRCGSGAARLLLSGLEQRAELGVAVPGLPDGVAV